MEKTVETTGLLAFGDRVVLRDSLLSDVDIHVHWLSHGQWRRYDAPWERKEMTTTETEAFVKRFRARCEGELPLPRRVATIATRNNKPLGWVSRYENTRFPTVWYVGIDICDDGYLGRGVGTEALSLWIDYLFRNSDISRISLDTWSLNPRMMRVAEKLGFLHEGVQREVMEWQGERLGWVHYGMLRREWEERGARATSRTLPGLFNIYGG